MIQISIKELQLAAKLLETAADLFSNHGCNDLPDNFWDGWTKEEIIQFDKEFHEWNGDPENHDPKRAGIIGDDAVMSFMADKLLNA